MAIAAALGLSALSACGGRAPAPPEGDATQEATYLAPPRVETARAGPDGLATGGVTLIGVAAPGGRVRLSTPAGEARFAPADAAGRWTITLPPAVEARVFGLSVALKGRSAQGEGYILVTPGGQAALLRAGASALRLDPAAKPGLRAVDFDRGGGMEVSAAVPAGATVTLQLDGRQVAQGRADKAGRYEVSLGTQTPIRPGAHQMQLFGDGYSLIDQAQVQLSPAAPLANGPLRSQLTPAGLRVDWMTPGGGVQSTLLVH